MERLRRVGGALGTALGVLAALGALAVLVLHHVSLTWTHWAAATSGAPWVLAAAVLGVLLSLPARRWVATGTAALLVLVAATTQLPLLVGDDVTNDGPRLVVLTSNLEYGQADLDVVADAVRAHDVDLLLVQELTPEAADGLTTRLADVLPHHALVPGEAAAGSGVLSRYPLDDVQALPDTFLTTVLATARVPSYGAVRVGSAHPVPPWPVQRRGWEAELAQVREALHAVPSDLPVVVGGDLNATWDHPELRRVLDRGYRDAAEQAGAGWLRTWPSDRLVPVVALDHVLVRDAQAAHVETLDVPGTDHRAVLAEVVLP